MDDQKILSLLEDIRKTQKEDSKVLGQHSRVLDEHTKILGQHTGLLQSHTELLQKLTVKVIEHDERFDHLDERLGKMVTRDEYLDGEDKAMVILKRLDQERVVQHGAIKLVEAKVEEHAQDLVTVKQRLQIA